MREKKEIGAAPRLKPTIGRPSRSPGAESERRSQCSGAIALIPFGRSGLAELAALVTEAGYRPPPESGILGATMEDCTHAGVFCRLGPRSRSAASRCELRSESQDDPLACFSDGARRGGDGGVTTGRSSPCAAPRRSPCAPGSAPRWSHWPGWSQASGRGRARRRGAPRRARDRGRARGSRAAPPRP